MKAVPAKPALLIHHDDEAEVFINGELVKSFVRWTSEYIVVPLEKKGAASLKAGRNVLAVHCHQTGGGQYIDVGLTVREASLVVPARPPPATPSGLRAASGVLGGC